MDDAELARRRAEERRAVEEAGGGVSEGFEQSEELLIEHTQHGDQHTPDKINRDADGVPEEGGEPDADLYGEADEERTSEDDS